jgi:GAF domain-containing protein
MVQQLKQTLRGLERQVADRTRDLERRSAYLAASAEVSRAVSSILDTDQLVRQVVDLIREQFKLYYVGLFLVDEAREWAVLRAGTGEAGKKMLERGHRLKIGAGSMIGWSISNAQARIALEAESDAQRRATSELPDTRSEAALPLRSRGQVVGALTVQSAESRAFDNVTISILQTMADQVAVALDNARLLAESQAALEAVQRAYGKLSREAWGELLGGRRDLGFRSDAYGIGSAAHIWRPEMEQAMQAGRVVQAADNAAQKQALAIPIKIGDTTIGILDTYKTGEWGAEEIALLEQITDQLAIALDSARLYQETQRRAARERMAAEITDKMRRAVDMDALIQTTIQELAAALSTSNAFLQLTLPAADKDAAQTAGEPAES